jgi:hypothetical protein
MKFTGLIPFVLILLVLGSCNKDSSSATNLTGTWIKGTNVADTLYFIQKNDQNILRYRISFNPATGGFAEHEYAIRNGKLALKNFMGGGNDFYTVESFNWLHTGKEFELLGYQLFPFMSSTLAKFTYKKID